MTWIDRRKCRAPAGGAGCGSPLAVLSVFALAAAACGGDDDESSSGSGSEDTSDGSANESLLGPEDVASGEPIKVGMVSDGATQAFDNTDELRAAQAAAEYYNNHKGGIDGRPIEVVTCETGADPAGATDCANQLVEAEVVAVALSQSAVADSVWEPLHAAGIPTLFFQTSTEAMLADTTDSFVMVNPLATPYGTPIRRPRPRTPTSSPSSSSMSLRRSRASSRARRTRSWTTPDSSTSSSRCRWARRT